MKQEQPFTAPWGTMLKGISISATLLLICIPVAGFVRRLGWSTRISLERLDANLRQRRSLFFSGWYRTKRVGSSRAFATDPRNTVVLRFVRKTIVVTPVNPEEFINELKRLRGI